METVSKNNDGNKKSFWLPLVERWNALQKVAFHTGKRPKKRSTSELEQLWNALERFKPFHPFQKRFTNQMERFFAVSTGAMQVFQKRSTVSGQWRQKNILGFRSSVCLMRRVAARNSSAF